MAVILIVEDSPAQLARLESLLKGAGHFVIAAENLDALPRGDAKQTIPDLVILDVNLLGM